MHTLKAEVGPPGTAMLEDGNPQEEQPFLRSAPSVHSDQAVGNTN